MIGLIGIPQGWEWIILVVIVVLLLGGSRLAGLGKGAGKAIREFKDEIGADKADKLSVSPETQPSPDTGKTG